MILKSGNKYNNQEIKTPNRNSLKKIKTKVGTILVASALAIVVLTSTSCSREPEMIKDQYGTIWINDGRNELKAVDEKWTKDMERFIQMDELITKYQEGKVAKEDVTWGLNSMLSAGLELTKKIFANENGISTDIKFVPDPETREMKALVDNELLPLDSKTAKVLQKFTDFQSCGRGSSGNKFGIYNETGNFDKLVEIYNEYQNTATETLYEIGVSKTTSK